MAAAKGKKTLKLVHIRDTKGTKVFGEAGDDDSKKIVRSLYIPKGELEALGHTGDNGITLTIEV